jgi:hypothetical protein
MFANKKPGMKRGAIILWYNTGELHFPHGPAWGIYPEEARIGLRRSAAAASRYPLGPQRVKIDLSLPTPKRFPRIVKLREVAEFLPPS